MFFDVLFAIFFFCIGAIFASFFGVVIERVPKWESIVKPGSHCDNCGHELKWYENIPIVSYICLLGRCKECKAKIPLASFLYEVIGGLAMLTTFLNFGMSISVIFAGLITLILLLIAGYDFKTNTMLDIFWIIYLVLCVGFYLYRVLALKEVWWEGLLGAGILLVFFLAIKGLFYLVMKVDALGTGDIIFMAISGLLLGYKLILIALLFASVIGSIVELTLIGLKKKPKDAAIPFCPYLTLGVFIAMILGQDLINLIIGV